MTPRSISSRDNPWLKRFRRAAERHDEEIVVEGRKQVEELIRSERLDLVAIATSDEALASRYAESVETLYLPEKLLHGISSTVHDQGVVALLERPSWQLDPSSIERGIVVLDRVQDPGNVGTLVRLAVAFGCDAVVTITGSADPYSPKALRASAGTALTIPIAAATSDEAVSLSESAGLSLLAADGEAREVLPCSLPSRFSLVLGSEGQGVDPHLLSRCRRIRIPISPEAESLNVAAAAAILLYELGRS